MNWTSAQNKRRERLGSGERGAKALRKRERRDGPDQFLAKNRGGGGGEGLQLPVRLCQEHNHK